jgi:hypothetical protein
MLDPSGERYKTAPKRNRLSSFFTSLGTVILTIFLFQDKPKRAPKQVTESDEFFNNLVAYLVVNIGLFVVDAQDRSDGWWFVWLTIFWGYHGLRRTAIALK